MTKQRETRMPVSPVTLADFRTVERNVQGYLRSYSQKTTGETQKIAETVAPEELVTYNLLLDDASKRELIEQELYEFAMKLLENWGKSSFNEKVALGLLVKKIRRDSLLWDLLSKDYVSTAVTG